MDWRHLLISGGMKMSLSCCVSASIYIIIAFNSFFFVGSRLFFNIVIFLRASKRLPEFNGLMGKVYPGQLKPSNQIPEPRIQLIKKSFDNGFWRTDHKDQMMPPKIIIVKDLQE